MKKLMMYATYAAAITSLLGVGAAMAQDTHTHNGTVVSVTDNTLVITTDDGRRVSYNRDAMSAFPASLVAGQRVRVEYNEVEGGTYHAANVTVLPADTQTRTATGYATERMPMTASPFPLLALLGAVALGAALSARAVAARRSR
jgi:RNase P/RNase MRP subunit p29